MKETKDVVACVVDFGLFQSVAHALAKGCNRVLYHNYEQEGFPTINKKLIGDGFEDVEVCHDIWEVKDEVDLWVFPDIQLSGLQKELESQGKAVWGSRLADSLELDREKFHKLLGKIGLEVPVYETVVGLDALRKHLKDKQDKFIKISHYRGSFETYHWLSWIESRAVLDVWAVKFGPAGKLIPFMVFDSIDTPLEIGADTFCIDGEFPSIMLHGDEWKDKGYLGAVTKREDMPQQVQEVMEAFAPILKKYDYRNKWSIELRVKGDKFYFIDPCQRHSMPATGSQLKLWKNTPDIYWYGANGYVVDPEYDDTYVAECILTCKGEKSAWRNFVLSDELKEHAIFANCCEIEGELCFPYEDGQGEDVGWLVATGKSIESTVDKMLRYADMLPNGVTAKTESLANLLKEIRQGEKKGIEFGDSEIPKPEIALNL